MTKTGERLREAREATGLSLGAFARLTHYSKAFLSRVERGQRSVTDDVVSAYERVLGVTGLDDPLNRREFLAVTGLAAANVKTVTALGASLAAGDVTPLTSVQTTYGVDLALASLVDQATQQQLRRWAVDESDPIARVNAAGIIAKLPTQKYANDIALILSRDDQIRDLYMTAVLSRVGAINRDVATGLIQGKSGYEHPSTLARRLISEVVNKNDAGARWCSAALLQRISPQLGR